MNGEGTTMAVFKKQGVYWIDYYVNGQRKRERIGPDKRLAETVLRKRKVEIAEGKFLERKQPVTTTFDELAAAYLRYARDNKNHGIGMRRALRSFPKYLAGSALWISPQRRLNVIRRFGWPVRPSISVVPPQRR